VGGCCVWVDDCELGCPPQLPPFLECRLRVEYRNVPVIALTSTAPLLTLRHCYAVLCCALLCCAVLCCAVLCCAVLCCAVLCCAVLCCPIQDYIDSMEGATLSGRQCAAVVLKAAPQLAGSAAAAAKQQAKQPVAA
jgi:uncharacterized protein with NAD-binding domain and iron-sulfur cluster